MSIPNYIKFRYTFDDETLAVTPAGAAELATNVINHTFKKEILIDLTVGYEDTNVFGCKTKPHLHIHVQTLETDKKIRNGFQSWKNKSTPNETRTRDALYSIGFANKEDMRDISRFFRYPIKQNHSFSAAMLKHCNVTSIPFDLTLEQFAANDEFRRAVIFNQKKQDK